MNFLMARSRGTCSHFEFIPRVWERFIDKEEEEEREGGRWRGPMCT